MTVEETPRGLPREPGPIARLVVYLFTLSMPVLVLLAVLVPVAIVVRLRGEAAGIVLAVTIVAAYLTALGLAFRGIRRVASRFTPPLALPGDIWNIGVAPPPKRSSNWPIRLKRRRPPPGGVAREATRLAA